MTRPVSPKFSTHTHPFEGLLFMSTGSFPIQSEQTRRLSSDTTRPVTPLTHPNSTHHSNQIFRPDRPAGRVAFSARLGWTRPTLCPRPLHIYDLLSLCTCPPSLPFIPPSRSRCPVLGTLLLIVQPTRGGKVSGKHNLSTLFRKSSGGIP